MDFYYTCKNCEKINISELFDEAPEACVECGHNEFVRGLEFIKKIWEGKKSDKAKKGFFKK